MSSLNQVARTLERENVSRFFLGSELHVNRTLHLHGLLMAPRHPDVNVWCRNTWAVLFERYGRSQLSRVLSREAVSDYVSKYCTKELTEWRMW